MNHLPAASHQVADYVEQLGDGFKIYDETDGNYDHVGATIADAILQANRNYNKIVRPRIDRIMDKYGSYRTTSQLRNLLATITVKKFLKYDSKQRCERFSTVLTPFERESIESCEYLRKWLQAAGARGKLLNLHGIGPKTADYFGLLVGRPDTAIDRRLIGFLKEAGVDPGGYNEAKEIIKGAAVILKLIWTNSIIAYGNTWELSVNDQILRVGAINSASGGTTGVYQLAGGGQPSPAVDEFLMGASLLPR